MNNKKNDKKYPLPWPAFVIATIIAMNIMPPLGIMLILWQFGVFNGKSSKSTGDQALRNRKEKYKIMTQGQPYESIEYLASAVGVSYESALRELQSMVSAGEFGKNAYINYVDKTIVLSGSQRQSAPKAAAAPSAAPKAAAPVRGAAAASQEASRQKKIKNLYKGLRVALLVIGIILLVAGIPTALDALDMIIHGYYWISELLYGIVLAAGGAVSLISRAVLKRRTQRFAKYVTAISGKDYISLKELAAAAGVSVSRLKRDLDEMIEKDVFGPGVYVDVGEGVLILRAGVRPPKAEAKKKAAPPPVKDDESRYDAILKEIRQLNDDIEDEEVSLRIDRMEDLTRKIFREIEEKPEKLPQIKSFMSYYLPTTLKLLHSYDDFEESGADGENVTNAKKEIERILDQLVDGFKKQLDRLYEAEAIDISSDIDVLENMMRRDGLSQEASPFSTGTAATGQ